MHILLSYSFQGLPSDYNHPIVVIRIHRLSYRFVHSVAHHASPSTLSFELPDFAFCPLLPCAGIRTIHDGEPITDHLELVSI